MKLEDKIKQTKNDLLIGENKSEEILEKVLRYKELNNNKYKDMYKYETEENVDAAIVNEIQPDKAGKPFKKVFSLAAAAALIIAVGTMYIVHSNNNKKEIIQTSSAKDSANEESQNTSEAAAQAPSHKEFFDLSNLEQNPVYSKFSLISDTFTIQDFINAFGENQASSDINSNFFYYLEDGDTIYNINANIFDENERWQKYFIMQFPVSCYEQSSTSEEDKTDIQKITVGMTFDEVNELFNSFEILRVDFISNYYSSGEYYGDITVQYLYYLERADGYSTMIVCYNAENQTVTHAYLPNEMQ